MKTTALLLALAALTGCTAFIAPKDPVTSMCQDSPQEWADTPNPLDTPETFIVRPEPMGQFGPHSEFYPTH